MTRSSLVSSIGLAALLFGASPASAQAVGAAQSFAILGGTAVTAAPPLSTVNGDVGIAPAAATFITGFPANATVVLPFANHGNDGVSIAARAATTTLFNSAALAPAGGVAITANLSTGGPSANGHYVPGKYALATGTAIIPTTITLDGAGIYVFSLNSDITTSVGSTVVLNGVNPCSVFWRVPTLATLNGTTFPGTVVAGTGVHLGTGATLTGRALAAAAGDVTLAGANNVGGCSLATAPGCPTITLGPATLPNGVIGTPFNQTISASGSVAFTFSVTGALPTGLSLNTATGAITGTPTAAGVFSFDITATDDGGCPGLQSYTVTILTIAAAAGASGIPTLSGWALMTLMVLIGFAAVYRLRV